MTPVFHAFIGWLGFRSCLYSWHDSPLPWLCHDALIPFLSDLIFFSPPPPHCSCGKQEPYVLVEAAWGHSKTSRKSVNDWHEVISEQSVPPSPRTQKYENALLSPFKFLAPANEPSHIRRATKHIVPQSHLQHWLSCISVIFWALTTFAYKNSPLH